MASTDAPVREHRHSILCCGFLVPSLTGLPVVAALESWQVIGATHRLGAQSGL